MSTKSAIPAGTACKAAGAGPYFLSRFTTGAAADGSSTFYYTLSVWNPYVQVIMKSTIQSANQTAPVIGLVANAEGGAATIAPNTWVAINGANLAPAGDTRTWQGTDFINNRMPTNWTASASP